MLKTLKPFQQIGSKFLQTHPHALLADEPGLGKTLQAIDAAERLDVKTVRVVCPASVRDNWRQELRECGADPHGWFIHSYEQTALLAERGVEPFDLLILDESHFLKTPESQRTQAIFGNGIGLARKATWKWALSGSPVLNRPRELYPILKTLAADAIYPYDTFPSFAQRFCGAYFDGHGINTRGASRLEELQQRLSTFMLRRTKLEVAPELPGKVINRIPLELAHEELKTITAAEAGIGDREAFISSVMENFSQLGDMATLLHAIGQAKTHAASDFIDDLLETQEKVVVFAHHRDVIDRLLFTLQGYSPVIYRGGMSDVEKTAAVEIFKNDSACRVFLANTQAAGTGINGLQEIASSVVFVELSWVPNVMGQAIDRLHRIGQKAGSVNAYLLHVPGTIESAVLAVHDTKQRVLEKLGLGNGWKTELSTTR